MFNFLLPNGSKVDMDGCVEAVLTKGNFPVHFLDTKTGDVCIIENEKSLGSLVERIGDSRRYFEITSFDDEDYEAIFKDFIADILEYLAEEKLLNNVKSVFKKEGLEKALLLLETDTEGFNDAWSQYIHDEAYELAVHWLKNLPEGGVQEKFEAECDCLICQAMVDGVNDVDGPVEAFAQQNTKNKKSIEKTDKKSGRGVWTRDTPKVIPKNIFQLKIQLQGSQPLIWRRVLVPDTYTFFALHIAIQDAMGWFNYHLHHFSNKPFYGRVDNSSIIKFPDESDVEYGVRSLPVLDERETLITQFLKKEGDKVYYEYDFGDGWRHQITLEKILPYAEGVELPQLVTGKNKAPFEDSGGLGGYYDKMEIVKNKKHPDHKDILEWVKGLSPDIVYDIKGAITNLEELADLTTFNKEEVTWSDVDDELKMMERSN